MVNSLINLSAYEGTPPADETHSRRIKGGPLYSQDEVLAAINQGEQALIAWTRKCKDDLLRQSMDLTDAAKLVRDALSQGRFHNAQWCQQKPSGPWAACDAYSLKRKEWVPAAHKHFIYEYYVKFAVGKTGKLLLLVSCHPPRGN